MENSKFFTNQGGNTLFAKFAGVFGDNPSLRQLDVLSAYFRASGYFKIRPLLDNVAPIRILAGIDVDAAAEKMQREGLRFRAADGKTARADWQKQFLADAAQAGYSAEIEDGILQFVADAACGKVQLRAHPSRALHAKIYIMRPDNFTEHASGHVITGSSNLTEAGLGARAASNYEFNVLLNDYADVRFATDEFEKLWEEGVPIDGDFVARAQAQTHLRDVTPYELYLKTLMEYFGDEVEFDPNSIRDLPANFKRLEYQMDAVNQAYQLLQRHNGCFLADVVGLGKTLIAALIMRQFYFLNGFPNYRSKILLIIPPALRHNWRATLRQFALLDVVDIVTNGSLHKVDVAADYDMVVADESHKFRNNSSRGYAELQGICKAPTRRGARKKVILISATPLNNYVGDIYNQLMLFQDGNQSTLDMSLSSYFARAEKKQRDIRGERDRAKARADTIALYEQVRDDVIAPLTVRRTRSDLEDNERYKQDLKKQGIRFPTVAPPAPVYYRLSPALEKLFDGTLAQIANPNDDSSGLRYMRYRLLAFLLPEIRAEYLHAEHASGQLAGIMKTLLLKRMDSSFFAFAATLKNFLASSAAMLKMIDDDRIVVAPDVDVERYVTEDRIEELMALLAEKGLGDPSVRVFTREQFEPEFIAGVRRDHEILQRLAAQWGAVQEDPKADEFARRLPSELLDKGANPEQKLVVFTESQDTMTYLRDKIGRADVLGVSSRNSDAERESIRQNFDANMPREQQRSDINVLICTDVLAEGINLHRANTVVNYDTPWNATRLMQRIGRVNRIGSLADVIRVFNFYPTARVDDQIQLAERAKLKLQAFHSALGEDAQVLSEEEEVASHALFDPNSQTEKSDTLPYLEEIRRLKREDPGEFERIKNMPAKLRNARASAAQAGGTLAFMRTASKHSAAFYLAQASGKMERRSFAKAIKLLRADPSSAAAPLPPAHHQQVRAALRQYEDEMKQGLAEQQTAQNLAVVDVSAIKLLRALADWADTPAPKRDILLAAIATVENKVYRNLAPDLAKLDKKRKKFKTTPAEVLALALDVISIYNVQARPPAPRDNKKAPAPIIIISQSYVAEGVGDN